MGRMFIKDERFACTGEALEEVVYDMHDGIDFKSLSESEKKGYNKIIEMCRTILEMHNANDAPSNTDDEAIKILDNTIDYDSMRMSAMSLDRK